MTPSCLAAVADRSLGDTCFSLPAPVALWQRLCLLWGGAGWEREAVSVGLQGPGVPEEAADSPEGNKGGEGIPSASQMLAWRSCPSLKEEQRTLVGQGHSKQ